MIFDPNNPNPNDPGPIGDPAYNLIGSDGNAVLGATAGLPAFPTWPPPSGGAPVITPELGPILNPYPYGQPQTANISLANPAPLKLATAFPMIMPPKNGGNQNQQLPAWPHAKFNVLPDKADPKLSRIP